MQDTLADLRASLASDLQGHGDGFLNIIDNNIHDALVEVSAAGTVF